MAWFVRCRRGCCVISQSGGFASAVVDDRGIDEESEEGGATVLISFGI
jgi:hypothetical protein